MEGKARKKSSRDSELWEIKRESHLKTSLAGLMINLRMSRIDTLSYQVQRLFRVICFLEGQTMLKTWVMKLKVT
jgi:hypothetical protein